ncbi:hypothetical protein P4361_18795 [Fictibacillus sp. B-59209]|uniref:hypothetical protein n=1 Tax=Fictibacillus sp. B-59209 TaxID=3024873 RepID=UPI002E1AAB5A|nr:hypothetical protein [Fictibacillus sp. B-59209]
MKNNGGTDCDKLNEILFRLPPLPIKSGGISITRDLIKTTIQILNEEPTKTLPQNSRKDIKDRTPDGLDHRIKDRMKNNMMTACFVSNILAEAGIVEIVTIKNPTTSRMVKGTKLKKEWSW